MSDLTERLDHSPLPWSHDDNRPEYEGSYMVFDANGEPVAYFGDMESNTWEEISNARFIVQAVNAHGPLLEACKAALESFQGTAEYGARKRHREEAQVLVNQLTAAIAAAEGRA